MIFLRGRKREGCELARCDALAHERGSFGEEARRDADGCREAGFVGAETRSDRQPSRVRPRRRLEVCPLAPAAQECARMRVPLIIWTVSRRRHRRRSTARVAALGGRRVSVAGSGGRGRDLRPRPRADPRRTGTEPDHRRGYDGGAVDRARRGRGTLIPGAIPTRRFRVPRRAAGGPRHFMFGLRTNLVRRLDKPRIVVISEIAPQAPVRPGHVTRRRSQASPSIVFARARVVARRSILAAFPGASRKTRFAMREQRGPYRSMK